VFYNLSYKLSDFFFSRIINNYAYIVYLTGEITNGQTGTIILSLHPIFNSSFVFH